MTNFLEDVRSGKAKIQDFGNYLSAWHSSEEDLPYEEFMGLSLKELGDWIVKNIIPHRLLEAAIQSRKKTENPTKTYTKTYLDSLKKGKDPIYLSAFIEDWESSDDPRNLEDAIGISKESLDNWSKNHIIPPEILAIEDKIQKTSAKLKTLRARKEVYKELLKRNKIDD